MVGGRGGFLLFCLGQGEVHFGQAEVQCLPTGQCHTQGLHTLGFLLAGLGWGWTCRACGWGCCSWRRWCWKTLALVRLKHLKIATLSVFLLLGIGWAWTCWACGWGCCCRRRGCWETLVLARLRHLRGATLCCFFLGGAGLAGHELLG